MKNYILGKKIITSACVIYTVLITAVYLLGVYINSAWVPTLNMVFSLLIFSLILSAANVFLFSDKLVFAFRLLIHFCITTLCFYVVFVLWGGYKDKGGNVLSVLLIYTFAYIIFAALAGCFRYLTSGLRDAEKKYESQFSDKDNYKSQF